MSKIILTAAEQIDLYPRLIQFAKGQIEFDSSENDSTLTFDPLTRADREVWLLQNNPTTIGKLSIFEDWSTIQKIYVNLIQLDINQDGSLADESDLTELEINTDNQIPLANTTTNTFLPSSIAQSIFQVQRNTTLNGAKGQGTGWIYKKIQAPDGSYIYHVITNSHVIDNDFQIENTFQLVNTNGKRYENVRLIGHDRLADVAVLEFITTDSLVALVTDTDLQSLDPSEDYFEIGNTLGMGIIFTRSQLTAVNSGMGQYELTHNDNYPFPCLEFASDSRSGNSGSPITNTAGKVVAMHHAGSNKDIGNDKIIPTGINYAIPTSVIIASYENILENQSFGGVAYADWGIYATALSATNPLRNFLPAPQNSQGILITRLDSDGVNSNLPLRTGDIILSAQRENQPPFIFDAIYSEDQMHQFFSLVLTSSPNEKVILNVFRPTTQVSFTTEITVQEKTYKSRELYKNEMAGGILIGEITEYESRYLGFPAGVQLINAPKINLPDGSIITEINGIPVDAVTEFKEMFEAACLTKTPILFKYRYAPNQYNVNGGVYAENSTVFQP